VRECLQSLNSLVTKAEGGSGEIKVVVENIGSEDVIDLKPPQRDEHSAESAVASQAALPPASTATEPHANILLRKPRPVGSVVRYLQGFR